ncbi:3-hydroxyisobutyrate dehydrogenase, mitochondrial [Chrysoperla carnea]|uniref:3-hydroxyisobutyrate dehydrogenase, mitochondrial n=1 Tax=Chrysoperla carnea TaxID=189513 RepID=UPI001D073D4B|nr:3-hydroxyisobutyrate dehydrogenase, mitochondrial [Chrysoperla carnea]
MSHVGVIGIGNMGNHMARNLLKNGHELSVYDLSETVLHKLKSHSSKVTVCKNPREVAEQSEVVLTMLPNNDIVLDTYLRDDGVLKGATKGKILVDSSTTAPSVSKKVFEHANKNNVEFIDAPVSGGVIGAENQTLTFMVGGAESTMKRVEKVLLSMGKRAVHCGDVGSGQAAKICNNMLLAISMIGTSECLNLGIKLGLNPKTLTDIINTSTGRCWSSDSYNPVPNMLPNVPSSNDYKGGFSTDLVLKDLGLAQDAATDTHSTIFLGALSHQIYSTLSNNGFGNKDFAYVYQFLKGNK